MSKKISAPMQSVLDQIGVQIVAVEKLKAHAATINALQDRSLIRYVCASQIAKDIADKYSKTVYTGDVIAALKSKAFKAIEGWFAGDYDALLLDIHLILESAKQALQEAATSATPYQVIGSFGVVLSEHATLEEAEAARDAHDKEHPAHPAIVPQSAIDWSTPAIVPEDAETVYKEALAVSINLHKQAALNPELAADAENAARYADKLFKRTACYLDMTTAQKLAYDNAKLPNLGNLKENVIDVPSMNIQLKPEFKLDKKLFALLELHAPTAIEVKRTPFELETQMNTADWLALGVGIMNAHKLNVAFFTKPITDDPHQITVTFFNPKNPLLNLKKQGAKA